MQANDSHHPKETTEVPTKKTHSAEKQVQTTDLTAGVQVPDRYQVYDTEHLRSDWQAGLDLLIRDEQSGKRKFDRREVARALHLPPDWNWNDIRSKIQKSHAPEQEFNTLLGVLYRSDRSIEIAPTVTRVTPTEVQSLPPTPTSHSSTETE